MYILGGVRFSRCRYNFASMPAQDPSNFPPGGNQLPWFKRVTVTIATSPPGRWLVVNVMSRLDTWLWHASSGKLSATRLLGFPLLILVTRGAKSGKVRETPLIYLRTGEKIAVIASSLGSKNHPQWYRNLLSSGEAVLLVEGKRAAYAYRQLEGEERQECWQRMLEIYPGYDRYAELAGERHIPVVLFIPLETGS